MNPKTLAIAYMITVALDRGLPAVQNLLANWKQEDPTLEDWEKLKTIILDPRKELPEISQP